MSNNDLIWQEIAQQTQEIVSAETAVVALAESEGEFVYYVAAMGKNAEFIVNKRNNSANSGLCGVAFQGMVPVLVCNTSGDNRVRQDYAQAMGIKTALAVPIIFQNKLLGALMVLNRQDGKEFDGESEKILANYAAELAPVIFQCLAGE